MTRWQIGALCTALAVAGSGCSFLFDPGKGGDPLGDDAAPPIDVIMPDALPACGGGTVAVFDALPRFILEGEGTGSSPRWIVFRGCELSVPTIVDAPSSPIQIVADSGVVSANGDMVAIQVTFPPEARGRGERQTVTFDFSGLATETVTAVFLESYNDNNKSSEQLYSDVILSAGEVSQSRFRSMSTITIDGHINADGSNGGSSSGSAGVGGGRGAMQGEVMGCCNDHGGTSGSGGGGGGHAEPGENGSDGVPGGTVAGEPTLLRNSVGGISDTGLRGGHGGGASVCSAGTGGGGGGFIELTARDSIAVVGQSYITTNGGNVMQFCSLGEFAGAGAGGAILIRTARVQGLEPILSVTGGGVLVGSLGGGSKGRIRVDALQPASFQFCSTRMCAAADAVAISADNSYLGPVLSGHEEIISGPSLQIGGAIAAPHFQIFHPTRDPLDSSPDGLGAYAAAAGDASVIVDNLVPGLNRVCLFLPKPGTPGESAGFVCEGPTGSPSGGPPPGYCEFPISGNCYDVIYFPDGTAP